MRPTALAAALVLASAWGLGEAAGALVGITRAAPHLWRTEAKPVRREVVARSTDQEQLAPPSAVAVVSNAANRIP